jgi:hypothetical protein
MQTRYPAYLIIHGWIQSFRATSGFQILQYFANDRSLRAAEVAIRMVFAGYVSVCVQLYCVDFHCLPLHVSAYMTIFMCVGYFYFYFQMPEGFCFAAK